MNNDSIKFIGKALAKSTASGVRVYQQGNVVSYYNVYNISPDPALPYISEILNSKNPVGIITTPLFQFLGYVFYEDYCVIFGPSAAYAHETQQLESILFLLGIAESERTEYMQKLACAPTFSLEKMTWIATFVYSALHHKPFLAENVVFNVRVQDHAYTVAHETAIEALREADNMESTSAVIDAYHYERLLMTYIKHGRAEELRELFGCSQKIKAGKMAPTMLRQVKNQGLCAAVISARAAIAGGVCAVVAFRISDIYIQKFELLQDRTAIERLTDEMMIEFANRVHNKKHIENNNVRIFDACSEYISTHIFSEISVEQMADEIGFSRPYLCSKFKAEAGISLTEFIQKEKILEAKQFLEFTDKTLAEISSQLSFSSQSYFQTVFKKVSGETPQTYRFRKKNFA